MVTEDFTIVDFSKRNPLSFSGIIATANFRQELAIVQFDEMHVGDDATAISRGNATSSVKDLNVGDASAEYFVLKMDFRFFAKLAQSAVFNAFRLVDESAR